MLNFTRGNLFEADVEALVNTVNCVGHMGKGIALQFKKAFPDNFKEYRKACDKGDVQPGKMFIVNTGLLVNPKWIVNFPTKRHWRGKSKIDDIASGLLALKAEVLERGIKSIAIPPLGCGLGGLNWSEVRPLIEDTFKDISSVNTYVFEPKGPPKASSMPIGTIRPNLTTARALFVLLMHQYSRLDYRLTLLEIQKLAYFLQAAGEPLRLNYKKHLYGPYAHNLNKVLEVLEGHFTRGYGDNQKPDVEIGLLKGSAEEAKDFLKTYPESIERLEKVSSLIEGFETPYGMELLSSVHWVMGEQGEASPSEEETVRLIHNWNDRKKQIFRDDHVKIAFRHIQQSDWAGIAATTQ